MARPSSWVASYVEQYARSKSTQPDQFFMVAYHLKKRPSRMFYYQLEHLLTVVGGRRIQKSVVMVPGRALELMQELCERNDAQFYVAPMGEKLGSD